MYKDYDLLQSIKQSVEPVLDEKSKKKLPEVPPKGDFDLDLVLSSDFFFA
jgi:DNA-directed RNA polymerase